MSNSAISENSQKQLLRNFISTALNGLMDHIYKFNSNKYFDEMTKISLLNNLSPPYFGGLVDKKNICAIKPYNRLRYALLCRGKNYYLVYLDRCIAFIRGIINKRSIRRRTH